jgi:hypothetical protein
MESFSKLIGTISKKNGRKLRSSLSDQNAETGEDGADTKVKGEARLETASLSMNPGKIQDRVLAIGNEKRPVGVVSLKCIYIPAYRKSGVRVSSTELLSIRLTIVQDMVLPHSFLEVEEAFKKRELHKKISKKGYMYQRGGDMEVRVV